MMQPERRLLAPGVWWCRGCGCVKIETGRKKAKYLVPRQERERRIAKKKAIEEQTCKSTSSRR